MIIEAASDLSANRLLKNVGKAGKTRRYVVTASGWSKRRGSGVYEL
jgi:hypothetical protein